jgi:hypothetical protein
MVAIPHGGLGTREISVQELVAMAIQSPSHAVGLELYDEEEIWDYLEQLQSPSHTAGLEHTSSITGLLTFVLRNRHPTRWARNQTVKFYEGRYRLPASPSHPVGFEQTNQQDLFSTIDGCRRNPTRWAQNRDI